MLSRFYSIGELISVLQAEQPEQVVRTDLKINRLITDSRYASIDDTSCFFAIKTDRNDGHKYISDVYGKGARCFVVHRSYVPVLMKDAVFLKVNNSLEALQLFAKFHRKELKYPVVAITGSNGKTVVKEWLFQILSAGQKVFRSPKSYNSQIGVPLSILEMPLNAEIGILEAGISLPGEMEKLEKMIQPDIGLITNIYNAHLENFTDAGELLEEKLKLFRNCKVIFYRRDYIEIENHLKNNELFSRCKLLSWSDKPDAEANIHFKYERKPDHTLIKMEYEKRLHEIKFPFTDKASLENISFCLVLANYFKVNLDIITELVSTLPSIAMRLQQLQGLNDCTLINDTYNSDLTSLEIALNFLNLQRQNVNKTLILSDIYQSGLPDNELYARVNKMCVENGISRVIGVGKSISEAGDLFSVNFTAFKDTNHLLDQLKNMSFFNEAILIKGSRIFGFERISNQLEYKKHETTLEVNLSAVIDNLNYFKSQLKKGTGLMAMVKAFSYGTGSYEIANVLEHHGVDYLTVAYIDEGITLRKKGIRTPIMVMNCSVGEIREMIEFQLEPEVFSLNNLYFIHNYIRETGLQLKIHLKVESGMHRLGFEKADLPDLVSLLQKNKKLEVVSVFTHLVASENPSKDDYTEFQIRSLDEFCKRLNDGGIKNFKRHLLNSEGIIRFPDYQFDMVRLGIGLYGLTSLPANRGKLRSVICLKSRISQIKSLKAGESLGYGRNFTAVKDMITATVAIGYADGLSRNLGNGKWSFQIHGKKAVVLGNICMDMTMVDVTEIPGVREKDEVIILNGNEDIYEMAEKRNTIPYEILTSLSERVKRIYYYGD